MVLLTSPVTAIAPGAGESSPSQHSALSTPIGSHKGSGHVTVKGGAAASLAASPLKEDIIPWLQLKSSLFLTLPGPTTHPCRYQSALREGMQTYTLPLFPVDLS